MGKRQWLRPHTTIIPQYRCPSQPEHSTLSLLSYTMATTSSLASSPLSFLRHAPAAAPDDARCSYLSSKCRHSLAHAPQRPPLAHQHRARDSLALSANSTVQAGTLLAQQTETPELRRGRRRRDQQSSEHQTQSAIIASTHLMPSHVLAPRFNSPAPALLDLRRKC